MNIRIDQFLQDVKGGSIPDFGFPNELTFNSSNIGWHLFTDLISGYPKYQKVANYINEQSVKRRISEETTKHKSHSRKRYFTKGKTHLNNGPRRSPDRSNSPDSSQVRERKI